jgi:uncharacterized protein (DUF302 family)
MEFTNTLTIEHTVIASNQPYEKVLEALKARMGSIEGWHEMARKLNEIASANTPWEQITEIIDAYIGESGFTIFSTVEHTPLLTVSGKTSRAIQYMAGNPLLALQMSRLLPEVALYAPLHFVVYLDEAGQTFIAYDNLVSQLAQYQHEEITQVAQVVQHNLRTLLIEVTQ